MVDYLQQGQTKKGQRSGTADSGTENSEEERLSDGDADPTRASSKDEQSEDVAYRARRRAVWREPLKDDGSCSSYRHVTCGPTRRRPSARAARSWDVLVPRGPRGLGLSVELAPSSWPGHVCIKSVFPHEPAAATGCVSAGDILLRVNEMPVHGLTVQEVLHVLRRAGSQALLSLARPQDDDAADDAAEQNGDDHNVSRSSSSNTLLSVESDTGTFEVELEKVNHSLGLSLQRSADTALGHTIGAKVREPALSDPRIHAGDKVIQVNGVDTRWMSHAELVAFLRRCADTVTLTLYRDAQATPASPGSPVSQRAAAALRPEALQMLCGLALQREQSRRSSFDSGAWCLRPTAAADREQRQRRKSAARRKVSRPLVSLTRAKSEPDQTGWGGEDWRFLQTGDCTDFKPSPDRHSDSSALLRPNMEPPALQHKNSGSVVSDSATSEQYLVSEPSGSFCTDSGHTPRDSLISNTSEHSGDFSRSAEPQPSPERCAPDASVDPAAEDYLMTESADVGEDSDGFWGSDDSDAELHERHLRRVAGQKQEDGGGAGDARTKQPYRSVQPQQRTKPVAEMKRISSEERLNTTSTRADVGGDLLKWKGCTLNEVEQDDGADSQSFVVQLRRGWSARLGFSLHAIDGAHVVAQIHPDSVAEKDGRIRVGDFLIKVNGQSVSDLTSDQVIDLLRKSGGAVTLTLVRI